MIFLLCLANQCRDTLYQRRRRALSVSQAQDRTLQLVDLGRPAALQIVPHRRACLGIDRKHAPRQLGGPQPVLPQGLFDARPRQQNHPSPGERETAAGIAADAAGAGNDDPPVLVGHLMVLPWPATIRHENHNVGGMAGPYVWP